MKIKYEHRKFHAASLTLINHANRILEEYEAEGYVLSLRQLYYQFVARDLIPNTVASYSKLGRLVSEARIAGLISWTAIEDRNRETVEPYFQPNISDVFDDLPYRFAPDLWDGQENYVEVWVEKDALSSVIKRPANRWAVPYMACKGYLSSSILWSSAQRIMEKRGRNCHVIHLGDHDPSGIDMTRDITDRLSMFGARVEIHRIALNMDQVEQYDPPPNPAKETDSRFAQYRETFGDTSWELDALEPRVIDTLISEKIESLCDVSLFNEVRHERDKQRDVLHFVQENPGKILDHAQKLMDDEWS